jgi:hypothetical protein
MFKDAVGVPDCDWTYTSTSMRLLVDASVEVGTNRSYSHSNGVDVETVVPPE